MDTDGNAAGAPDGVKRGLLASRGFALIRIGVTTAIVAGLLFKLSPGELRQTVRDADPALLVAAAALLFVVQILVLIKWSVLLRARDIRPPLPRLARAFVVGNLLTNVLPTAIGGDVYRIYRVQHDEDGRIGDVTMSVLYERATGLAALTSLGVLGATFHFGELWAGVVAGAAGASTAAAFALALPRVPLPSLREGHPLRRLLADRRELVTLFQMALFSLVIQLLFVSSIALTGLAFDVHVSWWYWAFTTWVVAIAVMAPITLGGLGVREASFSALITRQGGTLAQGASVGFALAFLLVVANGTGLLIIEAADRIGRARQPVADTVQPAEARG